MGGPREGGREGLGWEGLGRFREGGWEGLEREGGREGKV